MFPFLRTLKSATHPRLINTLTTYVLPAVFSSTSCAYYCAAPLMARVQHTAALFDEPRKELFNELNTEGSQAHVYSLCIW